MQSFNVLGTIPLINAPTETVSFIASDSNNGQIDFFRVETNGNIRFFVQGMNSWAGNQERKGSVTWIK